jgi:anaerobic magnesium-protoporphyrin IX monomethyl ester cyclase
VEGQAPLFSVLAGAFSHDSVEESEVHVTPERGYPQPTFVQVIPPASNAHQARPVTHADPMTIRPTIILVNPKIGAPMDTQRTAPFIPYALLCLAAYLEPQYNVVILDQRIDRHFYRTLRTLLDARPLLVGLTCYAGPMVKHAQEVSNFVKTHSDVPVVWGGTLPTIAPDHVITDAHIDYVVQGDGEIPLLELANCLSSHAHPSNIKGLWSKSRDGSIRSNVPAPLLDLEDYPSIPYDKIDVTRYLQQYNNVYYLHYQVSKGCYNKCAYCYNQCLPVQKYRYKRLGSVSSELARLQVTYQMQGVYFLDDNFFALPRDYLLELAAALNKLHLKWQVLGAEICALRRFSRAEYARFAESGLTMVTIGVESGSPNIRTLINKRGTVDDIRQVVADMNGLDIDIYCNYIVNFPGETLADLRQTIALVFELKELNRRVVNNPFFKFNAMPGLPLLSHHPECLKPPDSLRAWSLFGGEQDDAPVYADYLREKNVFKSLFLFSLLADDKVRRNSRSRLLRVISTLYKPVAKARLRHLWFKWNIELFLFDKVFFRGFFG